MESILFSLSPRAATASLSAMRSTQLSGVSCVSLIWSRTATLSPESEVDGLGERYGVGYRLEGKDDLLPLRAYGSGYLLGRRRPAALGGELLSRLQGFIRRVAHRARYAQRAVVAEIAAYLAGNHGHAIGREPDALAAVEVIDSLYEPYAADLEEVVHVLAPAGESLDNREHEPEVGGDKLLARGGVAGARALQKLERLVVFQNGQARRVYAGNLDFTLQKSAPLRKVTPILSKGGAKNSKGRPVRGGPVLNSRYSPILAFRKI